MTRPFSSGNGKNECGSRQYHGGNPEDQYHNKQSEPDPQWWRAAAHSFEGDDIAREDDEARGESKR
jgi:hypothetical protein